MDSLELELAGERVVLHAGRAVHWTRTATLIVADVHLGKGAAFRRAGVAVPTGSTRETLARLDVLLARTSAVRLLVLGDLFHTALAPDEPTLAAFDEFRARHSTLEIAALRGNHDRGLHRIPRDWRIGWHDEGLVEAPFVFRHDPAADPRGYVLAGHLHPAVRLRARGDGLRLPAFWFGAHVGVLPSFGAFTGGWTVTPAPGDRVIAVGPDGLFALSKPQTPHPPTPTCTT